MAEKFAAVIADPRNPLLITHSLGSIFRARILAIACGYEDANDLDHLRKDPAFWLACGRLPGVRSMLAAHHIALGEHADLARNREAQRRPHRTLLRQLRRASASHHARYR